jgi:NADH dehydrogenase
MILVTGGTGFIGRALIRQLTEGGYPLRLLIRPSPKSPALPRGVAVEAAVSSLLDERNLRVALLGVDTVYHLAGAEWSGRHGSLLKVDIQGTQTLCRAAQQAGVKRLVMVSHLGADRASAYPLLKAKAIAEEYVRRSGVGFTILRTGIVFGKNDHFTTGIARLARLSHFGIVVPGDGMTLLQPLWVEDLVTCLVWNLEKGETLNQTISIGGPEFIPFNEIVRAVMAKINLRRRLIHFSPAYLRYVTIFLENFLPNLPTTSYWLDYLSSNRTCSLDTIPRLFSLLPSRFSQRLDYLKSDARRGQ